MKRFKEKTTFDWLFDLPLSENTPGDSYSSMEEKDLNDNGKLTKNLGHFKVYIATILLNFGVHTQN